MMTINRRFPVSFAMLGLIAVLLPDPRAAAQLTPEAIQLIAVSPTPDQYFSFTPAIGTTTGPTLTYTASYNYGADVFVGSATGTITVKPGPAVPIDYGTYLVFDTPWPNFTININWDMKELREISVTLPSCTIYDIPPPFNQPNQTCQVGSLDIETTPSGRHAVLNAFVRLDFGDYVAPVQFQLKLYYTFAATCPGGTAVVSHGSGTDCGNSVMEPVQVTQSFPTDNPAYTPLPLIAGKTTTIRMYPIQNNPTGGVGGQITVYPGSTANPPLGTLKTPNSALPQSTLQRDGVGFFQTGTSLDFEIPGTWTTKGDLFVEGKFLDLGSGTPKDPAPLTLHFQNQAKPFTVAYMEWCGFTSASPSTAVCPSDDPDKANDMADAAWFLRAVFPAADDGIAYVPLVVPRQTWTKPMTTYDNLRAFISHLRRWYIVLRSFGLDEDQLIAWTPAGFTSLAGGQSDPLWIKSSDPSRNLLSSVGHVAWVADLGVQHTLESALSERGLAHEIGHNLGLHHPATNDFGGPNKDATSCFPYTTSTIQNPGFYSALEHPDLIPSTAWDFMSYHRYLPNWLTPYTYDILIRGGFVPQGDSINRNWDPTQKKCVAPAPAANPHNITQVATPEAAPQIPQPVPAATPVDSIVISGNISQNGTASIAPSYRVSTSNVADQSDPSGAYCINFNNGAAVLSNFCFNAGFDDPEGGPNAVLNDSFAFLLPFPAQTTSIALLKQGVQLASVTLPSGTPSVLITSPKSGDTWTGGTRTITWTASEAGGAPLTYMVLYSSDGGNTYVPLNLDLTDTQFTLDPSTIMGGSQVYFRVLASDGINTSSATVGPITVNQTPKLTAAAPSFAIGNASASSFATGFVTLVASGGPVTIISASVDNGAFTIVGPPLPLIVPGGRRASLTVRFVPPANTQGSQSGTITIASNDPLSPLKVPITGNAFTNSVPNAAVGPKSLNFAAAAKQTQDLPVTITNSGAASLVVNSISISNPSFTFVGVQTPLTIPPNSTQSIAIRFTAPNSGSLSGTATINTNDPTSPASTVTLNGAVIIAPALSIAKTHSGNFLPSQQGATYTITVTNTGTAPTVGTVTVTDSLPSGLTLVSMAGAGWSCLAGSCTRTDALSAGANYPAITVTVNVIPGAASPQINTASVYGGGSDTSTAADPTYIGSGPAISIALNAAGCYTAAVTGVQRHATAWSINPPVGTLYIVPVYIGIAPSSLGGPSDEIDLACYTPSLLANLPASVTLTATSVANNAVSTTMNLDPHTGKPK